MKIKGISQPQKLTLAGFALPYLVIIAIGLITFSQPGSIADKWSEGAFIAFLIPLITAFIGAILVGMGSMEKEKIETKRKSLIHAFLFGFIWTAIFHFFITIYFFMQIVYVYAGWQHEKIVTAIKDNKDQGIK